MATAIETKVKHRISNSIDRRSTLRSTSSVRKRSGSNNSNSQNTKPFSDKPTPLDVDLFLPWICKEMETPNSVVVLTVQEKVPKTGHSAKSRTSKRMSAITVNSSEYRSETEPPGIIIPITVYFNTSGHLIEIEIAGCAVEIPKQVIKAVRLCIPFHTFFTKLSILKGGLSSTLLIEIGKMLPCSHLTDICLDGTFVPQGNYYVLLEALSHLNLLSVSRCSITDDICKELFARLRFGCPAEKCVKILNLSSNFITDDGVKFIGDTLRENRHLLHLNLAGNRITDIGCDCILKHLLEFPLTFEEIIRNKKRYLEFCKNKLDVFDKCMEEITATSAASTQSLAGHPKQRDRKKEERRKTITEESNFMKAKKMAEKIVGDFRDPFDMEHTVKRENYLYSIGNLKLCSLNLAYNELHFRSLTKILRVLSYQEALHIKAPNTGLLRIVLEGNFLPQGCPELDNIRMYLEKAVRVQGTLSPTLKRKATQAHKKTPIHERTH